MTLDNITGITEGSYTGFCKSQLITCNFVKTCNGVCPFEDALKHADKMQAIESLSAEPNCEKCAIKELWEETEKEDLVAVVRCKDCIHRIDRRLDLGRFMCEMFYGQGDVSDENFCQWGKRKTNNQRTQPQAFRYNTK